ncbi:hypothetical protein BASA81_017970 [Batrachochytrium salamandrivorans]|nr:hypothetical protein BASA81_017970 [Batrachochytrium salamandrivorans]
MHAKAQYRVGINAHVFYTVPEVSPRSARIHQVLDSPPNSEAFLCQDQLRLALWDRWSQEFNPPAPMHANTQHRVEVYVHVFYAVPEVSPRSERTPPVSDSRPTWRHFCAKTN